MKPDTPEPPKAFETTAFYWNYVPRYIFLDGLLYESYGKTAERGWVLAKYRRSEDKQLELDVLSRLLGLHPELTDPRNSTHLTMSNEISVEINPSIEITPIE